MTFRMRLVNPNDFPVRIPMTGIGRFSQHFQLGIIRTADAARFGSTPKWFRDFIGTLLPGDAQAVFRVVDAQVDKRTISPTELSVDALDKMPVVRRWQVGSLPPGGYAQVVLPGIDQEREFVWKFRNGRGEKVAAGDYSALGYIKTANGILSTGWMRFVVY